MALPPAAPAAPDPTAGAMPPDTSGDQSDTVVCTICRAPDGTYVVYAGDEPDEAQGGEEADEGDMGAGMAPGGAGMGGAGETAEDQGTPAETVGEALKAAMDVLQADASQSSGNGQSAQDQFSAGYSGQGPAPVSRMGAG